MPWIGAEDGGPGREAACFTLLEDVVAPRDKVQSLLSDELTIINVGLEGFATDLTNEGAGVIHLDWTPPAGGDVKLADLLSKLGG